MTFRPIAHFLNKRILVFSAWLLAILALQPCVDLHNPAWAGELPLLQDEGSSAAEKQAEKPETQAQLSLGDADRSRDRDAMVPLLFAPRPNNPVGDIQAEIQVPSGPWRFQRAEAPPRSEWKVSGRQRRDSDDTATIELNIISSGKHLPKGLLGYLRFRLDDRESPLPSGLAIGKLQTFPPAIEVVAPGSSGGLPGFSNDPTLTPTITCFFFSH